MRAWPQATAIASGLILSLGYPRWNIGLLVWVWVLPLLWVLWSRQQGRRRTFFLGYLAGLAYFIPNLWWVRHSSRVIAPAYATDHSWAGWPQELMGFGAVVGLAGYCALYFGGWACFAARVARPRDDSAAESLRSAFLCAAMWVGLEWLRGILFTGFGWDGLGVALHRNHTLIQMADVIGVSGLSFLPMFTACVAWNVIRGGWNASRLRRADVVTALLLLAATAYYGVVRQRQQPGDTQRLNLLLVQPNVPQAAKWEGDDMGAIYQRLADLTGTHLVTGTGEAVDLVVWPENAVPVPLFAHADHPAYFNDVLRLGGFSLLTGATVQQGDGPFYNSALLLRGSFENQQMYHKACLVPFGEYLPFRDTFPFNLLIGVLPGDLAPGKSTEPLRLEKPAIGLIPLICFEDTVGRHARNFVRDDAQLIVNITNDGWFLQGAETEIHLANAIFRAVELRRPMVRAANTGVTAVIDEKGRIISRLAERTTGDTFIEGALPASVQVPLNPPRTIYARFGDWFSITIGLIALLAAVRRRFREQE